MLNVVGGRGGGRKTPPLSGELCNTAVCRINSSGVYLQDWHGSRRGLGTLLCRDTFLGGRRMLSAWLPASPRRTATQIAVELQKKRRSPTPSSLCHRLSGRIDGCHYRTLLSQSQNQMSGCPREPAWGRGEKKKKKGNLN